MMGCSIPSISVSAVFSGMARFHSAKEEGYQDLGQISSPNLKDPKP